MDLPPRTRYCRLASRAMSLQPAEIYDNGGGMVRRDRAASAGSGPADAADLLREHRSTPSLLERAKEVERPAGRDPGQQRLQFRGRGRVRPRPPAAPEEAPGVQPG